MHDHVHNNRIGCLFFSSGSICKQKNQQGPCITPRDTAGKKIILTTVKKVEIYGKNVGSYTEIIQRTSVEKKMHGSFLWIGFNCFKVTEPLPGASLLFTTKSPGLPRTHLIKCE